MAPPGHSFAHLAAASHHTAADLAEDDDYAYSDESFFYPPGDLVLRHTVLNPPKSSPAIPFLLTTGIRLPGVQQLTARFCADFNLYRLDVIAYLKSLSNTSQHPPEAYGFLHPSVFTERFLNRMNQPRFQQGGLCSFFLLEILRWKIAREVEQGAKGFVVEGLEQLARVTREFVSKIAHPIGVICFQAPGSLGLGSRAVIEQFFNEKELIRVPVGRSLEETYSRLLAETIGKYAMPSSPPYSPSP